MLYDCLSEMQRGAYAIRYVPGTERDALSVKFAVQSLQVSAQNIMLDAALPSEIVVSFQAHALRSNNDWRQQALWCSG